MSNKDLLHIRRTAGTHGVSGDSDVPTWALPDDAVARLGQGRVQDIALSPDRSALVVGTSIGLWWYEQSTMSPITLSEMERGMVSALAFSQDGARLATGNGDGIVRVWDVQRGICVAQMERLARRKTISRLAFSPDGQLLAAAGMRDYIVDTWHAASGEQLSRFCDDSLVELPYCSLTRPVAFSPNSSLLACTSPDDTLLDEAREADFISVWQVARHERIACLTEHIGFVHHLCFSPCGRFLASGGKNGTVQVWTVADWKLHKTYANYGECRLIPSYSPQGRLRVAAVSRELDAVAVWDIERDVKLYTYLEERGRIRATHFLRGNQLAIAGASDFKVWTAKGHCRSFSHLHTDVPDSLVFSQDKNTLAAGYGNEGVRLWDMPSKCLQQPLVPQTTCHVNAVSVGTTSKIHSTSINENIAKVWEVGNDTPIAEVSGDAEIGEIVKATLSPKGNLLACGALDGNLFVWDMQRGEKLDSPRCHTSWIESIIFSPDEKYLASTTPYGPYARLRDIVQGEEVKGFPGNSSRAIAFSPCSTLIACGQSEQILLWHIRSRETFMEMPQQTDSRYPFALAFSPCARYLASGAWWTPGVEKVPIRLWEVASGRNIATFRGHPTDVQTLVFAPDSTMLASGSLDGTILLWDMTPYL